MFQIKKQIGEIIKYGFHKGVQVYKNKTTGKYFKETKKGYRISDEKVELIMALHNEGMSLRGIGRIAKCNHITAKRIILKEAERLSEKDLFVPISEHEPMVEMDEMWGFIKKK